MAEAKKRKIRRVQTVREKSEAAPKQVKTSKLRSAVRTAAKPVRTAHRVGKKEFYLHLPDNKVGRFLNKRRSAVPSYFRNSFKELRGVKWPSRKETTQLTIAVFVFAIIFGAIITVTDYGLDKLFKKLLLK